jgi:hypothetical protein
MRKLFYMGLESYEAATPLQLTEWNRRVFDRGDLMWSMCQDQTIDNTQSISVGQVLDAHGRSYFSMSQMMNLVQMMRNGEVTNEDVIYFEDMFQPGIESLPYILDQVILSLSVLGFLFVVLLRPLIRMILFMYGAWRSGCRRMKRWLTNS